MNFKGFDYRGIGPKQDNIYVGGNKFFTSSFGYGGSFYLMTVIILTLNYSIH